MSEPTYRVDQDILGEKKSVILEVPIMFDHHETLFFQRLLAERNVYHPMFVMRRRLEDMKRMGLIVEYAPSLFRLTEDGEAKLISAGVPALRIAQENSDV